MQSSIPSRKFAPALPRRKSRINVIGPATRAYLASLGRAQDRADSLRPPLPSQMFKPALCIAASLSAASGFVVTAPVRGENLHASPPRPHLVACTAGAHLPAAAPGLAALESSRASAWRCGLTPSACSPADPSSPTVLLTPPLPPPPLAAPAAQVTRASNANMVIEPEAVTTLANMGNTIAASADDFGGYFIPIIGLGTLSAVIALLAGPVED